MVFFVPDCLVINTYRYFLDAVKRAANTIPLVQMFNLASLTNRTGSRKWSLSLLKTQVQSSGADECCRKSQVIALLVESTVALSSYAMSRIVQTVGNDPARYVQRVMMVFALVHPPVGCYVYVIIDDKRKKESMGAWPFAIRSCECLCVHDCSLLRRKGILCVRPLGTGSCKRFCVCDRLR